MTQNPIPKILWVDDTFVNDLHELMAYEDELKYSGGYVIKRIDLPDKALDILEKGENFVCIILDIMMPYGKHFTAEATKEGTKTGIILAERIRTMDKYMNVPIVLLTGLRYILETLAEHKIGYPCFIKANISAKEFLGEINTEIEKANLGGGNREKTSSLL